MSLLFQQPTDVERLQLALTKRFLQPALGSIAALLLEIRAETDQAFGDQAKYGKLYPIGYCAEITHDVMARLIARLGTPRLPGELAIKAFIKAGGIGRCVWGILRERYFQTALQVGGLYVDIANDTVDVRKPKVEILPMAESGFEAIRDAAHFATIANAYWGLEIYANHVLPSLAPLMPMIGVSSTLPAHLQSDTQYMVELFRTDRFARAEAWLSQGAAPPADVVEALRARCPAQLLAAQVVVGRDAAIQACRSARETGLAANFDWRNALISDFRSIDQGPMPTLARG